MPVLNEVRLITKGILSHFSVRLGRIAVVANPETQKRGMVNLITYQPHMTVAKDKIRACLMCGAESIGTIVAGRHAIKVKYGVRDGVRVVRIRLIDPAYFYPVRPTKAGRLSPANVPRS